MPDDPATLRLSDSLSLFRRVINNSAVQHVGVILFLNKIDLLPRCLKDVPLAAVCPDYGGAADDVEAAKRYLMERFSAQNKNRQRRIYKYFTHATDHTQLQSILKSVMEIAVKSALKYYNLI